MDRLRYPASATAEGFKPKTVLYPTISIQIPCTGRQTMLRCLGGETITLHMPNCCGYLSPRCSYRVSLLFYNWVLCSHQASKSCMHLSCAPRTHRVRRKGAEQTRNPKKLSQVILFDCPCHCPPAVPPLLSCSLEVCSFRMAASLLGPQISAGLKLVGNC